MKARIRHWIGGIKGTVITVFVFLLFPFARIFLWHKKIWIISEYGYEARDNGYSFFKYLKNNHREINCYYAIDFKSSDYEKVNELGDTIKFGSFKHIAYWCAARYIISSKTQGFCPNYYLTLLRKHIHLWGKYVFLQHGITKDDQKFLYKKNAKIDLFICGAKPEYEDIRKHYGYKQKEISYTGFARFDEYFESEPKRQILVMPTWRRYVENTSFENTEYYKVWSEFLNSSLLDKMLSDNNVKLIFYVHPHFKDYSYSFSAISSRIEIAHFDSTDLQRHIREASLFITDFSSLAFDFGYMGRPVIYYQYDEKEYFSGHYIKGYFDYRKDGFGPVFTELQSLLFYLRDNLESGFVFDSKYFTNRKRFFPIIDNQNSYRIFKAITEI